MMFEADALSGGRAYQMMIDSIVPRPIAWVTTVSKDGVPNLAPFSFFTGVTSRPPTLALSITKRVRRGPGGSRTVEEKHTVQNLQATQELIVHVASRANRERVVASAADLPSDPRELETLGFEHVVAGTWVDVPRLADLGVAMECRVDRIIPVGEPAVNLVLARILGWHVQDGLVVDGRIPVVGLDPLGRLGVDGYQE
jgi:flavin reductase (DIM6/NTAB) family NADH-FMN oxidoreductase RutF